MVDLSTKKPPFSRAEIESSLLEYILGETSNEPTQDTAEAQNSKSNRQLEQKQSEYKAP